MTAPAGRPAPSTGAYPPGDGQTPVPQNQDLRNEDLPVRVHLDGAGRRHPARRGGRADPYTAAWMRAVPEGVVRARSRARSRKTGFIGLSC